MVSNNNDDDRSEAERHDWTWDTTCRSQSVLLVQFNTQVIFHPTYSSGTAAILGNTPLCSPHHHYWEVKMLSPVYGTDVMVGLATRAINTASHTHSFASLLGHDGNSWGFSYQGFVQHKGVKVAYGARWGKGSTVGVHYDAWRGTVEFYIDRRPLGMAFTGLQGKDVFPIVSSTAAKSELKLVTAQSFTNNLQFSCLKRLADKLPGSDILNLCFPPGLRSFIINNYWFFINLQQENCLEINPESPNDIDYNLEESSKTDIECKKRKRNDDESQSEDEGCFLLRPKNLRSKKLALMKKCQAVEGSPHSQQTPCTSQDVYYKNETPKVVIATSASETTDNRAENDKELYPATPQRKKRFRLRKK